MWISCFYPPVSQNLPSETCPFLSSPFYSSLSALFIHPLADSVFTSKMQSRQMGASGKNMTKSTSIGGDMYTLEKNDGSQSDTAVGTVGGGGKKRRSSIGAKMVAIVGLSRKSRSTSQLSQTGRNWIFFPPSQIIILMCIVCMCYGLIICITCWSCLINNILQNEENDHLFSLDIY